MRSELICVPFMVGAMFGASVRSRGIVLISRRLWRRIALQSFPRLSMFGIMLEGRGKHLSRLRAQEAQLAQKMKREAPRSRARFANIERLPTHAALWREPLMITPEGKDHFRVTIGDGGITGDIVGNFVLSPRLYASFGKVALLQIPER
jgi:hypothetical protein